MCITSTTFAIIIDEGSFIIFQASRGLRQGNPLSPLLFIIVMEALNMMIDRAKEGGRRNQQLEVSRFSLQTTP